MSTLDPSVYGFAKAINFLMFIYFYISVFAFVCMYFCICMTQKSTLATLWMDIANLYESIPHKLIVLALRRYGVSPQWIRLVKNYYKGIFKKSFSESATSAWHRHQQRIFACCTLSIILFLAGMNIILEYSLQVKVPKFTTNNTELPLLLAFMDDLYLMSSTVSGV